MIEEELSARVDSLATAGLFECTLMPSFSGNVRVPSSMSSQSFTRDTSSRIRHTDDNKVLESRFSYRVNDKVRLSFEGLIYSMRLDETFVV